LVIHRSPPAGVKKFNSPRMAKSASETSNTVLSSGSSPLRDRWC
jgi:hypothetical protein